MRIALIGCSKEKRKGRYRAEDLYISTLFVFSLRYARKHFDAVYILSAKYGLLKPDRRIRDYDITLNTMSVSERRRWAGRVGQHIRESIAHDAELHFFCGRRYWEHIVEFFSEGVCFTPLRGLRIGEQLQWLKSRL